MTAPLDIAVRCDLYALTARLFAAEVDVALYRALAAQDTLGLIGAELSAMGEERALEALAVEFCRLFIGPQPLCVPYASVHRGEALLGGRTRTRLEAFLRRVGFPLDAVAMRIASPDHLAVELTVLAHLYGLTDTAAVREFLCDHVLPWAPAYCEQLAATFGTTRLGHPEYLIGTEAVKALTTERDAALVSIRSWAEYSGATSGYTYIQPKGRIVGDVWGHAGSAPLRMDHYRNIDNTMRNYHDIAAQWCAWGITPDKCVTFYCGTGWRASEAFFYAYLMGWPTITVYDGGWWAWVQNPDNPIAVGTPQRPLDKPRQ